MGELIFLRVDKYSAIKTGIPSYCPVQIISRYILKLLHDKSTKMRIISSGCISVIVLNMSIKHIQFFVKRLLLC
jgi:hypothetical protein